MSYDISTYALLMLSLALLPPVANLLTQLIIALIDNRKP